MHQRNVLHTLYSQKLRFFDNSQSFRRFIMLSPKIITFSLFLLSCYLLSLRISHIIVVDIFISFYVLFRVPIDFYFFLLYFSVDVGFVRKSFLKDFHFLFYFPSPQWLLLLLLLGLTRMLLSWYRQLYRSIRLEVFWKKGIFRNFAKFTGKHLRQSLFFNKVAGREFCEISKNTFIYRTPLVVASCYTSSFCSLYSNCFPFCRRTSNVYYPVWIVDVIKIQ